MTIVITKGDNPGNYIYVDVNADFATVVQNVSLGITDIATGSDVTEDYVTPKGGSLGRLRPCTTGSCSISALGGPFLWK